MEVKPGYKQTEAGMIPEDWQLRPMLSAVRVANGQVDPKVEPYCSMTLVAPDHIESGSGRLLKKEAASTQRAISGKYLFSKGDIVYSKIRPYLRKAILADFDGLCSADMYPLKPAIDVSSGFIFAAVLGNHFSKYAESVSVRSGMPKINRAELAEYTIALPPTKAEQEAIAEALSDADALIESLGKFLAKKRQLKQGAMQELLTGKKRLPGFSGEWEVKKLDVVADTDPENLGSGTRPNFTFNYIALEDVDVGTLSSCSEQVFRTAPARARRKLHKDDVLVSTVRPKLRSHLLFSADSGNWVCSTGFCVVRCKEGVSHPGYVYFHMFADCVACQIEALLTGSNYPAINGGDVRALRIPFPNYEEQTAIAAILSDMDAEIAALEAKLAKARQIKQGLMQELLTGRIRLI
jgi:type I restriction enzyme S subunit